MLIENSLERYHIECESNPKDKEIVIRMYQYDVQVELQNRYYSKGVLHVRLPRSAVLYLRHGAKTPNELKCEMYLPYWRGEKNKY